MLRMPTLAPMSTMASAVAARDAAVGSDTGTVRTQRAMQPAATRQGWAETVPLRGWRCSSSATLQNQPAGARRTTAPAAR
jgi:hypothetical protein